MPTTRQDIATLILSATYSATSYVFCLEDSIGETQVEMAEKNLLEQLTILQKQLLMMDKNQQKNLPLLFIRIRTSEHLQNFGQKLGSLLQIIDGFSLPKAAMHNLPAYFDHLIDLSNQANTWLWALPILESKVLMDNTKRMQELSNIYHLCTKQPFEERILTIRIGLTDLCGLFGIRRPSNVTIYEISLIRDFITDVSNIFLLDQRFVVSGGVWEFFQQQKNLPLLLKEKNKTHSQIDQTKFPQEIVGLIQEVQMDKLNGLMGKTCIHPTHILPINSQLVVSQEDYLDANQIMFHINGAKYYQEFEALDVSNEYIETILSAYLKNKDAIDQEIKHHLANAFLNDEPDWQGMHAIKQIQTNFNYSTIHFIKPSVGETTRVLLRRVPEKILIHPQRQENLQHIFLLAKKLNVPMEGYAKMPYSCCGLIKQQVGEKEI